MKLFSGLKRKAGGEATASGGLKLNYTRTFFVGFAFFLICHFWQAYDTIIPKILTDKFGMSQTWSGVIMALDNILALFMLPIFGAISDKCRHKRGKRTPFILFGTLIACAAILLLSAADAVQTSRVRAVDPFNNETALETLWEADPVIRTEPSREVTTNLSRLIAKDEFAKIETLDKENSLSEEYRIYVQQAIDVYGKTLSADELSSVTSLSAAGVKDARDKIYDADPVITAKTKQKLEGRLSEMISKSDFLAIELMDEKNTTKDYDEFVLPARQAYAAQTVKDSPVVLILFILVLFILLLAMGVFRSPAVALMPDVTPKPLRSKGNAIINLMGAAGGILILVLGILLGTGKAQNATMGYFLFFLIVIAVMLVSLAVFFLTVKEPRWAQEADEQYKKYYPEDAEKEPMEEAQGRKLSKGELLSLLLILASVALWFMGYNAVTSKFSVYAGDVLKKDYNLTLIVAQAAAILSYVPVGILSSKIGRKKAILIGVGLLTAAFGAAAFITKDTPSWLMTAMFVFAGIGWATINVNSFPMVVELATGSNTGKYTGYYYTASMAAQIVTPILSGVFLDIDMRTLFPYAVIFTGLSFVTMLFVRHGDSKPIRKTALEAIGDADGD